MDANAYKSKLKEAVDGLAGGILKLSHEIHDHPECGFEERFCQRTADGASERPGLCRGDRDSRTPNGVYCGEAGKEARAKHRLSGGI